MAALIGVWAFLALHVIAQCPDISTLNPPNMATGYHANLLATGLKAPRSISIDTAGSLLVAEQQGGGIKHLNITDYGDTVCANSIKALTPGETVNPTYSTTYHA